MTATHIAIIIAAFFFATTGFFALAWQIERNRSRNQDVIIDGFEKRLAVAHDSLDATQSALARKQAIIGKYLQDADALFECNTELERRNEWLEFRRNVILARWWKQRSRDYRQLVSWQVRKAGGA